jgi:hypothetical protein
MDDYGEIYPGRAFGSSLKLTASNVLSKSNHIRKIGTAGPGLCGRGESRIRPVIAASDLERSPGSPIADRPYISVLMSCGLI